MFNKVIDIVIESFSKALNRLLSFHNPMAASLSEKSDISLNAIKSKKTNSIISPLAHYYTPYKIDDTEIGDYTYVAANSKLSKTKIGKFCSIGPNIISGYGIHPTNGLSTSPMFYSTLKQNSFSLTDSDKIQEREIITIGNDVFIGMNVIILDGITIGDGAIIGAGSIVSKNIPPYSIAVGSPIVIKKKRFTDNQIEKLLKIKWWNFEKEKLQDVEKMFFNIDEFIDKYYID